MSITIQIDSQLESQLRADAEQRGMSVEQQDLGLATLDE
jgi:hypothetical protein